MQDSRYDAAFDQLIKNEGGFVDDPDDPGGATNWGVSLRWLRDAGLLDLDGDGWPDGDIDLDGDIDADDIRALDLGAARQLYFDHWWRKYGYGDMPDRIGEKAFDLSVNMGSSQAHKCLQRAARACGEHIFDDGVIGDVTRRAVAAIAPSVLLPAFRSEAAGIYRQIAARSPASRKFLNGWLRRAYG